MRNLSGNPKIPNLTKPATFKTQTYFSTRLFIIFYFIFFGILFRPDVFGIRFWESCTRCPTGSFGATELQRAQLARARSSDPGRRCPSRCTATTTGRLVSELGTRSPRPRGGSVWVARLFWGTPKPPADMHMYYQAAFLFAMLGGHHVVRCLGGAGGSPFSCLADALPHVSVSSF